MTTTTKCSICKMSDYPLDEFGQCADRDGCQMRVDALECKICGVKGEPLDAELLCIEMEACGGRQQRQFMEQNSASLFDQPAHSDEDTLNYWDNVAKEETAIATISLTPYLALEDVATNEALLQKLIDTPVDVLMSKWQIATEDIVARSIYVAFVERAIAKANPPAQVGRKPKGEMISLGNHSFRPSTLSKIRNAHAMPDDVFFRHVERAWQDMEPLTRAALRRASDGIAARAEEREQAAIRQAQKEQGDIIEGDFKVIEDAPAEPKPIEGYVPVAQYEEQVQQNSELANEVRVERARRASEENPAQTDRIDMEFNRLREINRRLVHERETAYRMVDDWKEYAKDLQAFIRELGATPPEMKERE